jgi:hypothetical protein
VILRRARPEELTAVGELTLTAYEADGFLVEYDDYAEIRRSHAVEPRMHAHRARALRADGVATAARTRLDPGSAAVTSATLG